MVKRFQIIVYSSFNERLQFFHIKRLATVTSIKLEKMLHNETINKLK